jgi:iron complex outermembrane recepter protein
VRAAGSGHTAIVVACLAFSTRVWGAADEPAATAAREDAELDEVVVTGSHIHGTDAAGSQRITIDRGQIDASGYGRIEDVMATVTQNFNRSNGAVRQGADVDNYNRGAEVQLRGLGAGTTLTLVNGQRQGASGYQGSFIDISSIPASAVDRIEILPEGSSALYGSDAIGGVVNVILRRDLEGFETRVRASTADGDATERTLAALWGHSASTGHILLGIQYDESRALTCSARARCATNGDFRQLGGSDWRSVGGNPGTLLDPATLTPVAAIPRGQDGTNLTPSQLIPGAVSYANSVVDNDILPKQIMRSALISASRRLSKGWELTLDGRYSSRDFKSTFPQPAGSYAVPGSNAFNHLGGPVLIASDFTPDIGPVIDSGRTESSFMSAALTGVLSHGWQLRSSLAFSRASNEYLESNALDTGAVDAALADTDPATALNLFGDGSHTSPATLAALHFDYRGLNVFTTTSANLIVDGPLLSEPAGPVRLAVGGELRREHSVGLNIADEPEDRARVDAGAFVEFAVPLVAPATGSASDRLDLSLAGRYDHYSDAGSTLNPKIGLSWRPIPGLVMRGNRGTSFRPPPFFWSNPDQVGDGRVSDLPDPKSPSGFSRALQLFGPLPDLKSEHSTSWSLGADWTPAPFPGLTLSTTYFDIDYKGKVRNVGTDSTYFLVQEAQLASLIIRNPTQAQINAACQSIVRFVPGTTGGCSDPIAAIIDARFRNLAHVKTHGLDVAVDYALDSAHGKWAMGVSGTYTFVQDQQITATAPVFDVIDTVGNPLKLRLTARLAWSFEGWMAQAIANHSGSYRDPGELPARSVASWTTVDLNLGYRVGGAPGGWAGTQVNISVTNLFDRSPPFVDRFDLDSGSWGYDAANASLVGRQISLQFVKRWGR